MKKFILLSILLCGYNCLFGGAFSDSGSDDEALIRYEYYLRHTPVLSACGSENISRHNSTLCLAGSSNDLESSTDQDYSRKSRSACDNESINDGNDDDKLAIVDAHGFSINLEERDEPSLPWDSEEDEEKVNTTLEELQKKVNTAKGLNEDSMEKTMLTRRIRTLQALHTTLQQDPNNQTVAVQLRQMLAQNNL
ncbi:hypothetical protein A3F06_01565 [candidate division TM6 bacterium RIFCSPHIGHO2_12_FULL_36_22]|nr:MAG: hypothetical protein A3F06_01565 [candidate division TM6 bacterium RIFCSPHIGHO2_12_FULL_36_22]